MRSIVAAVLVFFSLSAVAQQQPQIPQVGETIEVSIVNVDVFVTDKKGNRVRGLTKNDFEIREDGKLQPITNFAEYSGAPAEEAGSVGVQAATPEPAATTPHARRTIVIFIERFRLPELHTKPFFEGLREFLRRTVRPGDAAAIVTWRTSATVRQEFTDDLEALEAALDHIEAESVGVQENLLSDLERLKEFEEAFEADLESDGRFTVAKDVTENFNALSAARFDLFRIKQKTAAINALMQSMSGADGKKIVLLATNRYGVLAGAEYFRGADVPPQFRAELDTRKFRESLTRTANANGITLYPIYPVGLATTPYHDAMQQRANVSRVNSDDDVRDAAFDHTVLMNETGSLTELADRTGGLTHYGSKNIVELLPRIADDLESYYSLAYRATNSGKDDARKLVVRTKNPDYVIRTRREFVEKSDATRMNDRVIANLFQQLDGSVLPIEAEVGELKKIGKRRWTAPLLVKIPIGALTVLDSPKGPAGGFSVYVASGGAFGVMGEIQQRTQPFAIDAKDIERARTSHFTYELTLTIDHISDRISIGVLDELSKEFGLALVNLPERGTEAETTASR